MVTGITGGFSYYNHLWYLYVAILLYMLTPFINAIISNKNSDKLINLGIIIWLIYSVILKNSSYYLNRLQMNDYFNLDIMAGYLGYYILGYKLGNMKFRKKYKWGLIFFISWIITGTFLVIEEKTVGSIHMQEFMCPGILIMSIAIFEFFKEKYSVIQDKYLSWIKWFADKSLGCYLIHYVIRDYISIIFWRHCDNTYIYTFLCPIIIVVLSIFVVTILKKFYYINKYMLSL